MGRGLTDDIYPNCNAKVQISKNPSRERISQTPNQCFTIKEGKLCSHVLERYSQFIADAFILHYLQINNELRICFPLSLQGT